MLKVIVCGFIKHYFTKIKNICNKTFPVVNFYLFSESLVNSNVLEIMQVSREHMGVYLCIASNGIPPPAIKKTKLEVACELNLSL